MAVYHNEGANSATIALATTKNTEALVGPDGFRWDLLMSQGAMELMNTNCRNGNQVRNPQIAYFGNINVDLQKLPGIETLLGLGIQKEIGNGDRKARSAALGLIGEEAGMTRNGDAWEMTFTDKQEGIESGMRLVLMPDSGLPNGGAYLIRGLPPEGTGYDYSSLSTQNHENHAGSYGSGTIRDSDGNQAAVQVCRMGILASKNDRGDIGTVAQLIKKGPDGKRGDEELPVLTANQMNVAMEMGVILAEPFLAGKLEQVQVGDGSVLVATRAVEGKVKQMVVIDRDGARVIGVVGDVDNQVNAVTGFLADIQERKKRGEQVDSQVSDIVPMERGRVLQGFKKPESAPKPDQE